MFAALMTSDFGETPSAAIVTVFSPTASPIGPAEAALAADSATSTAAKTCR